MLDLGWGWWSTCRAPAALGSVLAPHKSGRGGTNLWGPQQCSLEDIRPPGRAGQPGLSEGTREGRESLSGRGEKEVVRLVTDGHGESLVLCSTSGQSFTQSAETQRLLLLILLTVHLRQTWGPRVHKKCPGCSSAPSTKPRILWWGKGIFKE